MKNKAQSAMEYLMTYGWAILIVIVVVAALYSMGVFSGGGGGVACSPCFGYFAFVDYATGTLRIRNGARTITDLSIIDPTGTSITNNDCTGTDICSSGHDIEITGISTTDKTVNFIIQYQDRDSTLYHNDTATIHNP